MRYYLAVLAVPENYKPDEELLYDVDFYFRYFRKGKGYSTIESTNMLEIRKENFDKWLTFLQTT